MFTDRRVHRLFELKTQTRKVASGPWMPNPIAKSGWVPRHNVELTGGRCDCQSLSLVMAILAFGFYDRALQIERVQAQ